MEVVEATLDMGDTFEIDGVWIKAHVSVKCVKSEAESVDEFIDGALEHTERTYMKALAKSLRRSSVLTDMGALERIASMMEVELGQEEADQEVVKTIPRKVKRKARVKRKAGSKKARVKKPGKKTTT